MKFVYLLHIGIKSFKFLKQKQLWFGTVGHYLFSIKNHKTYLCGKADRRKEVYLSSVFPIFAKL